MRVIVGCDKFKGSLTAAQVGEAVRLGVLDGHPSATVDQIAVADGGDGTVDAAVAAGFDRRPVTVSGPTGEPVTASIAVRGRTAVVELADCCGLVRLPDGRPAPLTASSRGLGEAMSCALGQADRLIVGVGGSASTDGGSGMLAALGARLLDAHGHPLPDGGGALVDLATVDLSGLDPRLATVDIVLASDVTSPLLGPHGAAAVFGPQKGADPSPVVLLEQALARWASVLAATPSTRSTTTATDDGAAQGAAVDDGAAQPPDPAGLAGAGAAGGVGFALLAVLGARCRPGIEVVLELADAASVFAGAELVVTGEGSLDRQSLLGKTPAGVAQVARAAGVPVVAVCGRRRLDDDDLAQAGFSAAYALTDLEPDESQCMAQAAPLLRRLAERLILDFRSGA
jgi:glycerate kinase